MRSTHLPAGDSPDSSHVANGVYCGVGPYQVVPQQYELMGDWRTLTEVALMSLVTRELDGGEIHGR